MLQKFLDAFDACTGHRTALRALLDLPVPGGARFVFALGTAILALCFLQALTGIVLAAHYSPSSIAAWVSIVFLEERVFLGKLARGLHVWGADALLVVLVVYYTHTT